MSKSGIFKKPDAETLDMIKRSGSINKKEALAAQEELAIALQIPLRQGMLDGDVLGNIFETLVLEPGATPEFPLDLLAPGSESRHVAYTNPGHGRIPERTVQGDYVMIPTFGIANSIDWLLHFAADARYDVVSRAMEVLRYGFVKKMNNNGWHTLLSAGADRNIVVYDADATAGFFTKRLVSLMKTVMVRSGGGNTGTPNRGALTDLYVSHEALEDIRNWGVDQIDEVTRREIFMASDDGGVITRIFGVNLHPMDELGVGQEYQDFYTTQVGASLATSDVELVIGLDLAKNDSFVMPMREEVSIFSDDNLHRSQKAGFYGWARAGWGALDGRRIIVGSF